MFVSTRFLVAAIALLCAIARPADAAPDLVVPKWELGRTPQDQSSVVRVVVENRGTSASAATTLELSDRPFLCGISGTSPPYAPRSGAQQIWIDHARQSDGSFRVELAMEASLLDWTSEGEIQVVSGGTLFSWGPERNSLWVDAPTTARWSTPVTATGGRLFVGVRPSYRDESVVLRVTVPKPRPVWIMSNVGMTRNGTVEIALGGRARTRANRTSVEVPPLDPGQRFEIRTNFECGTRGEFLAWVDPEDRVDETLEGNNVAVFRDDSSEWSLAALHIHSSFSEGPGSFDWQCLHGALSGYDLLWWSEHDWRMNCVDHLDEVRFEDDGITLRTHETDGARATVTAEAGVAHSSLRLSTDGAGQIDVRVRANRSRFSYVLASEILSCARVTATKLGPADTLIVSFELSKHPGEQRRLAYLLRPEKSSVAPTSTKWAPMTTRSLPEGSATTLEFPLTDDANAAWKNGSDNNLMEIRILLHTASDAEVTFHDFTFDHEVCGQRLTKVQENWTTQYPNLEHRLGGEVSFGNPHLIRYGGAPELLDFDQYFETVRLEIPGKTTEVIRRAHLSGGVISWAHPFGPNVGNRKSVVYGRNYWTEVLKHSLADADLLEVGYRLRAGRPIQEYLDRWDRTLAEGIRVIGLGVNDSHHMQWGPEENNLATWIQAPSSTESSSTALLDALRAGHVFFADPIRFRGRLVLETPDVAMGGNVTGVGPRSVHVSVAGAPIGSKLHLVASGVPVQTWTIQEPDERFEWESDPKRIQFVRAELWGEDETPLAFSNPLFFLGNENNR